MATPLSHRDVRELAAAGRPPWVRRLLVWVAPFAALTTAGVHAAFEQPMICTDVAPCRPDMLGSLAIGLLFAAALGAAVSTVAGVWLSAGFVAAELAWQAAGTGQPAPVWMRLRRRPRGGEGAPGTVALSVGKIEADLSSEVIDPT